MDCVSDIHVDMSSIRIVTQRLYGTHVSSNLREMVACHIGSDPTSMCISANSALQCMQHFRKIVLKKGQLIVARVQLDL